MASSKAVEVARALAGALIGGLAGYYGFLWVYDRGFYALALPGLVLGAGCGALAGTQSTSRGVLCGLAGLALGIFSYWKILAAPPTLPHLVTHLHEAGTITLALLAIGAIGGYWFGRDPLVFGFRGDRKPAPRAEVPAGGSGPFTPPGGPPRMEE